MPRSTFEREDAICAHPFTLENVVHFLGSWTAHLAPSRFEILGRHFRDGF